MTIFQLTAEYANALGSGGLGCQATDEIRARNRDNPEFVVIADGLDYLKKRIAEGGAPAKDLADLRAELDDARAAVRRLTVERNEYARVALFGLAGMHCPTPELGYVHGGGVGQLTADMRRAEEMVASLRAELKACRDGVEQVEGP